MMARPKEMPTLKLGASGPPKMSQAFENKSQQEHDKLQQKVVSGLREDLMSLFEQELHTDLIVTNGNYEVRAHHCILQSRAQRLWQESLVFPTTDKEGLKMKGIRTRGLSEKEIRDFLRQLYCVADSELLFRDFLPHLYQWQDSEASTQILTAEQRKSSLDSMKESGTAEGDCRTLTSGGGDSNQSHVGVNGDIKAECKDLHMTDIHTEITTGAQSAIASNSHLLLASQNILTVKELEREISDIGKGVVSDPEVALRVEDKLEKHSLPCGEFQDVSTESKPELPNGSSPTPNSENIQQADDEGKSQNIQNVPSSAPKGHGGIENNGKINNCAEDGSNVDSSAPQTLDSTAGQCTVDLYQTSSALGSDLLRMYVQQLHCDCCLSVEGVQYLAHKCILSARSPYFNAMFGGQWSESNLEVVHLEGVSAAAMEKVLLFFYGGVTDVFASSDIIELFIAADMYGVETMKLVLQFALKKDMCHFFHKPCATCTARAPEALSLCHNFHMEDLQDRLLKWIAKYFTKIWCTKAFASLPESVHQLCVESVVSQMREVNVLDIIMDCDKLTTSLPRIKWTEAILCLTTQLMDLAIEYTSTNFIKVIHTPEFLTWAKIAAWKASALEEIFTSVIDSLPVDTAISVYQTLIELKSRETLLESPEQNLLDLLDTMIKRCEKFLRTHISLVTRSKQWFSINKSFQSQILENSSYFHLDHFPEPKPHLKKPVLSSKPKLRPSPSPSSSSAASSSSTTSSSTLQTSKRQASSSATGQRPPRERVSKPASRDNFAAPSSSSKNAAASSTTASKPSKTIKSSSKPSTKAKFNMKHNPEGPSARSQSPKGGASRGGNFDDDGATHQANRFACSSSLPKPDVKSLSSSPGRLSSSSPSRGQGSALGRSPPSKIPLKTAVNSAVEQSSLGPKKFLVASCGKTDSVDKEAPFHENTPNATTHGQPSIASTDGALISQSHEAPGEEGRESSLPTITAVDSNVVGHDSTVLQGMNCTHLTQGNLEDSSVGLVSTACNLTTPNSLLGDLSLSQDSTQDLDGAEAPKFDNNNTTVETLVNVNSTVGPAGEICDGTRDKVCEQQETNFIRSAQPVKVSFIVPTCDKDDRPT